MLITIIVSVCASGLLIFAGWLLLRHPASRGSRAATSPSGELTGWDLRSMAFHEAGHAVCSFFLPEREKLLVVTISPSSEAFGMIRTSPRPHHNETRTSLSGTIAVLLAGRIAEEMFLNVVTTSCVHDLAAARQLAFDMVRKFGMGESLGLSAPGGEIPSEQEVADIRRILLDSERQARKLLTEHAAATKLLAETLLRERTIRDDRLEAFFAAAEKYPKTETR